MEMEIPLWLLLVFTAIAVIVVYLAAFVQKLWYKHHPYNWKNDKQLKLPYDIMQERWETMHDEYCANEK